MSSEAPPRPRVDPPRKRPWLLATMALLTALWIVALVWLAWR